MHKNIRPFASHSARVLALAVQVFREQERGSALPPTQTRMAEPVAQKAEADDSRGSFIGISLAVGANFLVSVSLNVQKYAHNRNTQNLPYTKLPLWWLGMLLNALGELGNLLALGFAPASVVTPVGAVGVVFNAVFASMFLKEPFRKIDLIGLVLIITGIIVVVLCSKESNVQLTVSESIDSYFSRWQFYVYLVCLCGGCAWLVGLYKKGLGTKYMSIYILLCSLISSITVLSCKVAVGWVAMTGEGKNQFNHVLPYVAWLAVIVSAVVSVHYLQQAMQHFGNNQVVPVYYATFTLACVVGAAIVYKELDGSPADKLAGFFIGILVAFGGVFAIGMRRKIQAPEAPDSDNKNLLSDQDLPSDSKSIEMQSTDDAVSKLPAPQKRREIRARRMSFSISGMDLDIPEIAQNDLAEVISETSDDPQLPPLRRNSVDRLFETVSSGSDAGRGALK